MSLRYNSEYSYPEREREREREREYKVRKTTARKKRLSDKVREKKQSIVRYK